MENFSYKTMALKGLKYFVIFALPFLATIFIQNVPDIANLTIGGLLVMAVNYLKVKAEVKLP